MTVDLLINRPSEVIPYMVEQLKKEGKIGNQVCDKEREEYLELKARWEEIISQKEAEERAKEKIEMDLSEDEEDDQLEEGTHLEVRRERTNGISSEVQGIQNPQVERSYKPNKEEDNLALKTSIKNEILFQEQGVNELNALVSTLNPSSQKQGTSLVKRDEENDTLHVVKKGENQEVVNPLDVLQANCSKQSQVLGENTEVLEISRVNFQRCVVQSKMSNQKRWEGMMVKVPVLSSLTAAEANVLIESVQEKFYTDGEILINQHDLVNEVWIIDQGEAIATKAFNEGEEPVQVNNFHRGEHFSQLALLAEIPQEVNVIAKGNCTAICIDRRSASRLVGSIELILKRNLSNFNGLNKQLKKFI